MVPEVPDTRATWRSSAFDRIGAGLYDFVIERERLAALGGRILWGTDIRHFYRRLGVISAMADGSAVLDVPCGGGVAFRAIRGHQRLRYIAADVSPGMLFRARRQASRRGLEQIEFVEADVEQLPFRDESFDLVVSLNSLHCFPDPQAALSEIARCLRQGGRLVSDCVVKGSGRRYDRVYSAYQRLGIFAAGGTADDLVGWLDRAGFEEPELQMSGAVAHIAARRQQARST